MQIHGHPLTGSARSHFHDFMSKRPTTPCLLDEQLDRADEDRIVVHVETCSRCQERLMTWSATGVPNPAWLPSPPAGSPPRVAPGRGPPARGQPRTSGPADPAPATPPDVTVDLARIAQLPTSSDPTPAEPDHPGGAQEPTDVDFPEPPDRPATSDARPQPITDSQVTTDFIPPRSIGPIVADAIEVDNGEATDDGLRLDGDRTVTQSGPSAPAPP